MAQIRSANCADAAMTFTTAGKWSVWFIVEETPAHMKTTLLQLVLEANLCLFVLCTSSSLQLYFILYCTQRKTKVHVDEFYCLAFKGKIEKLSCLPHRET